MNGQSPANFHLRLLIFLFLALKIRLVVKSKVESVFLGQPVFAVSSPLFQLVYA